MVELITNEEEYNRFLKERGQSFMLRTAIGFCKKHLEIVALTDRKLKYEERMNFEKCLTENFLLKYGIDCFGKRDLIYLDLYGIDDLEKLNE